MLFDLSPSLFPQSNSKGGNDAHLRQHIAARVQPSYVHLKKHLMFIYFSLISYDCSIMCVMMEFRASYKIMKAIVVLVLQYCCQASKYIVQSEKSYVFFQGFIVFPVKGKKVMSKPLMFTGVDL